MKRYTIIIAILVIAICIAWAASPVVDTKVSPTIPLPVGYSQAMTALGSYTNSFHCMSANWLGSWGCWQFWFYDTNGTRKVVNGTSVIDGPLIN